MAKRELRDLLVVLALLTGLLVISVLGARRGAKVAEDLPACVDVDPRLWNCRD